MTAVTKDDFIAEVNKLLPTDKNCYDVLPGKHSQHTLNLMVRLDFNPEAITLNSTPYEPG